MQIFLKIGSGVPELDDPEKWHFPLKAFIALTTVLRYRADCDVVTLIGTQCMAGKRKKWYVSRMELWLQSTAKHTDILAYSCQSIVLKNTAINALYIQLSSVRRYNQPQLLQPVTMTTTICCAITVSAFPAYTTDRRA